MNENNLEQKEKRVKGFKAAFESLAPKSLWGISKSPSVRNFLGSDVTLE